MADRLAPVCPQRPPDVSNETEALQRMPRQRLDQLRRLTSFLVGQEQQSEDCLYLNLYTPVIGAADRGPGGASNAGIGSPSAVASSSSSSNLPPAGDGSRDSSGLLPVLVFIHGESFEWNSGNAYDGSVIAARGHVVVITLNYRLGIFGFLPPLESGGRGANNGLLDVVAALHWVAGSVTEFGGDPLKVTVFGHGHGAALANLLMLAPMARGLFQRVILMSGSALSPWAMARDSVKYTRLIAHELNCPVDDNRALIDCLKSRAAADIVGVGLSPPEHLSAFGPIVDGIAVPREPAQLMEEHGPMALFRNYAMLAALAGSETHVLVSAMEDRYGMDVDRRERVLRTLVRNLFSFHQQEIYLTVLNEYTDWSASLPPHPLNILDGTLEAVSDALVVAPLIRTAQLHSKLKGTSTYVGVFGNRHRRIREEVDLMGDSVRSPTNGEDYLAYVFGAPLVNQLGGFGSNYTPEEEAISEASIEYWTSFARDGYPSLAEPTLSQDSESAAERVSSADGRSKTIIKNSGIDLSRHLGDEVKGNSNKHWPPYDLAQQKFMQITVANQPPAIRDHYRAHRLALWTHLIPQLHRSGGPDVSPLHHLLDDHDDPRSYEGQVIIDPRSRHVPAGSTGGEVRHHPGAEGLETKSNDTSEVVGAGASAASGGSGGLGGFGFDSLLLPAGAVASSSALSITLAVGCCLLFLNALIFAGVYYQRDKTARLLHEAANTKEQNVDDKPKVSTATKIVDTTGGPKSNLMAAVVDGNKAALRSAPSGCSLVSMTSLGTCGAAVRLNSADSSEQQHEREAICDSLTTSMLAGHTCMHTHSQKQCVHECPSHMSARMQQQQLHDARGMHHQHDLVQAHRTIGITSQAGQTATLNVASVHGHKHLIVKTQMPSNPQQQNVLQDQQQNVLQDHQQQQQQAGTGTATVAAAANLKSLMKEGSCALSLGASPDLTINVSSFGGTGATCPSISAHQHHQPYQQQQQHLELNMQFQKQTAQHKQIELHNQRMLHLSEQTQLHLEDLIEQHDTIATVGCRPVEYVGTSTGD
ncbi:neuroligin-1-like [Varroa destructor]|uniref:Carboxylesterase type B domain-containing protein n=1 Tax=Varroa destructor TaxID=109461 RepID=A0A7M7KC56_VARDE|nr:neuroligin-1-like [Varroa destructor]